MKNKFLIKLYVPMIDCEYEIYIPSNESVQKVMELVLKSISELSDGALDKTKKYHFLDPDSSTVYKNDQIIRDTNITNSKKIILI